MTLTTERPRMSASVSDNFDALIGKFYRDLYLYAHHLTCDPTYAEDLTQETFLRAYLRFGQYDPARPFRNWLYRIAYHLWIDELRRRKGVLVHSLDALLESDRAEGPVSVEFPDSAYDPQRLLEQTELSETLEQALLTLPQDFRSALVLCDLHELSYEEISGVLGCSVGTVRSRIHRARTQVRAYLEGRPIQKRSYRRAAPLPRSGAAALQ